jgi:glycerate 2-kinase
VSVWRQRLRAMFVRTVGGLDLPGALRRHLQDVFPVPSATRLLVLAFGKAARPMAAALLAHGAWGAVRGLVVPPEPDDAPQAPFDVIPGGHPLPTAGSLQAARRALELAHSTAADETAVFLVSGGGSALLELPADPAVPLAELRELYRALVACGAGIADVNTVRRHLSAVKGGRLAMAATRARALHTFQVADVPAGTWGVLASGPSEPEPGTLADCRAVLDRFALWPHVPAALRARLDRGDLPPGVPTGHELWQRSAWHLVQQPRSATTAMLAAATAAGLHVVEEPGVDDWPYERAAERLLARLDQEHRRHPGRAVAVLTGGELSVPLPPAPGTGGRNQQFALHCARRIRGRPIAVLSGGTDGIDGTSPAAGAVVDGTTMARARRAGLDVHDALRRCDAFPLLHALGDTIVTGPTGNNLRDLRLLVHG